MERIKLWLLKVVCCLFILLYGIVYSIIMIAIGTLVCVDYLLYRSEEAVCQLNEIYNDGIIYAWKDMLKSIAEIIKIRG